MKHFAIRIIPFLLMIAACRSAGGIQTQNVDIAYPDADVATLNLTTTAGTITVSPTDTSGFHGTLTTNVDAWRAQTSSSGTAVSITQGAASADVIPDAQNAWDLQVGKDKALILNLSNTAANTTLNLGGLLMSQLNVTATSGNYALRYAAPHPAEDGGTAAIQLTNGDLEASGLLNSHLNSLSVTTAGGSVQLAFDGAPLTRTMHVRIDTQTGDILLKIPPTILARVVYRASSGVVLEVDPEYTKVNEITYSVGNDPGSGAPSLDIEIRSVVGDLRLAGA